MKVAVAEFVEARYRDMGTMGRGPNSGREGMSTMNVGDKKSTCFTGGDIIFSARNRRTGCFRQGGVKGGGNCDHKAT